VSDFLELGRKHGTDKVLHHGYRFFYPRFVEPLRDKNFKMPEIAYGTGASVHVREPHFPIDSPGRSACLLNFEAGPRRCLASKSSV